MAAVCSSTAPRLPTLLPVPGAAKYTAHALPHLLAGCADRDANVRQCAVYGLGVLAQLHPHAFAPHVPPRCAPSSPSSPPPTPGARAPVCRRGPPPCALCGRRRGRGRGLGRLHVV